MSFMTSNARSRVAGYLVVGCLLPLALSLAMPVLASPVAGFAEDDSWFYAQIAYQWPRVGFPSFDGVHPTSGFHLLWGGLLSTISWILSLFTGDKHIHAVAFTSMYLMLVGMVAYQASRDAAWRARSFCALFVFLTLGAFLMETALLTLSLLLLGRRLLAFPEERAASRAGLSVAALGVLTVLCRLDALVIVLVWALWGRRAAWSRPLAAGALLGVALQLAGMQWLFGEWFSVSSGLKAAQAAQGNGGFLHGGLKGGIALRAALGAVLAGGAWLTVRGLSGRQRLVKGGALLGVVTFSLGHLVLSDMRSWYFLPLYGLCWWTASRKNDTGSARRFSSHFTLLCSVIALTLVGYKAYRLVQTDTKTKQAWVFIDKLRHHVPHEEKIFEIDASGFPGYFSERAVINGDGLVNTYDYARRLTTDQLAGYLQEEGICWVIMTGRMAPQNSSLLLAYHGLQVEKAHAEPIYPRTKKRKKGTQLWKLRDPRCNAPPG